MEIINLDMKKSFYNSLNERQKRHFLGIEAKALGHGGITLVSSTFQVNRDTVSRGLQELNSGEEFPSGRIRKAGGGRKKNS
jgi:hypothetical protein